MGSVESRLQIVKKGLVILSCFMALVPCLSVSVWVPLFSCLIFCLGAPIYDIRSRGGMEKQILSEFESIQRGDLFFANLVKQDPGRARQSS